MVDLAQILRPPPQAPAHDRLPPAALARLTARLAAADVTLDATPPAAEALAALRAMYEPYVAALSDHLLMPLPGWSAPDAVDDWRRTPWDRATMRMPEDGST